MNDPGTFRNLRFDQRPRSFPRRSIPIILVIVVFTLLWKLIPPGGLYWLLMLSAVILTWMASYGWRQALANLIVFLHRLEQF